MNFYTKKQAMKFSKENPSVEVYNWFNEWGELKSSTVEPSTFEDLDVYKNGELVE